MTCPGEFRVRDDPPDYSGMLGYGRRTCTYCGSLAPDEFVADLRAGHLIVATTKNYKAYIVDPATRRRCKFYFEHLTAEQRTEIVDMLNAGALCFEGGFAWNPLPFFIDRKLP